MILSTGINGINRLQFTTLGETKMDKQTKVDMIVDPAIIGAATCVMDGTITVSSFVFLCDKYGWTVSSMDTEEKMITISQDTGLTDEDTNQPIINWHDITVS